MRLVSRTGYTDIPYDGAALEVYAVGSKLQLIARVFGDKMPYVLCDYDSVEAAKKDLGEMRYALLTGEDYYRFGKLKNQ